MPPLTRGPLPARVYWVRRMMVLGTAVLLVFAVGRLLGNGSDGSDDGGDVNLADSAASTTPALSDPAAPTQSAEKPRKRKSEQTEPTPTLAVPTGTCVSSDVAVTPEVERAVAGSPVKVKLLLRTMEAEACTWRVEPDSLAVSITSGSDDVWSSRDCPKAVATRSVVVRKAVTTTVGFTWNAKRSDDDCTKFTKWAMPGWYHVSVAALGGEPSDMQFQLAKPSPATVTRTVTPNATPTGRPQTNPSGKPSGRPSGNPSGAVEPD